MNRSDFGFLAQAFELTLNRRRFLWQAGAAFAALLLVEMTASLARMALLPDGVGWLLAFPLAYAVLMAGSLVSCAACRHARLSAERGPFDPLRALVDGLIPAASGSAVFFLASAGLCLVAGLLLGLGRLHPVVLGLLAPPLGLLFSAAVAVLVFGLLLFPPLASVSGGNLDAVFSGLGSLLRHRVVHIVSQLGVALVLAVLFTGLIASFLWGGWALLDEMGRRFLPEYAAQLSGGSGGFFYALEMVAVRSLVLAPGLLFLNACSSLVLASASSEAAAAPAFDEEEEAWLQP